MFLAELPGLSVGWGLFLAAGGADGGGDPGQFDQLGSSEGPDRSRVRIQRNRLRALESVTGGLLP